ncbi:MAG: hypothetical protein K9K67_12310 [Bacteriovoracaceae bacterium]|nr:hypothetical protein [Bacteriovoracaceae bacterium]
MPILKTLEELKNYPFSPYEAPRKVLMAKPDYYKVAYKINPHMVDGEGHFPKIDEKRALFQWEKLKAKAEEFGLKVFVIPGQENFPDMVFAANQTLPIDSRHIILSKMAHAERSGEVQFFADFFENHGIETKRLPDEVIHFEGTGDAIWHFGMDLLWCGHGFRTDFSAVDYLGETLGLAVVPLELVDENFYHLDTCMCILDSKTVAWTPKAFSEESQQLIDSFFPVTIEIPYEEARDTLACNSWSIDGQNILIPLGAKTLKEKLINHKFIVHELDTGEFLKAGGSVFCMKLAFF